MTRIVSLKMNPKASMRAKLVHIKIQEGKAGLFYATSQDLKGLLVAEPSLDALERAIPSAIADLYRAGGFSVVVTKVDDASREGTSPWVAFPAEVAKAELERQALIA